MQSVERNLAKDSDTRTTVSELVTANPLIRDADAAYMLGCSKATFWRRVADGTIPPAIKIGGMSRWRFKDIETVIEKAAGSRSAA
jgi:predicted DNA-binding transcriptional regulator AlpA